MSKTTEVTQLVVIIALGIWAFLSRTNGAMLALTVVGLTIQGYNLWVMKQLSKKIWSKK